MHQVQARIPIFGTSGLLFYITQLNDSIPDSPKNIWISDSYINTKPILRKITTKEAIYRFIAISPLFGTPDNSIMANLYKFGSPPIIIDGVATNSGDIHLYVEWTKDIDSTRQMLEDTIDEKETGKFATDLAFKIAKDGFNFSHDFINILRREYKQYWLLPPSTNSLGWTAVLYYSNQRNQWYSIVLEDDIMEQNKRNESISEIHEHIVFKAIGANDEEKIQNSDSTTPFSFAEEMISTALIELSKNRTRSAVIHAIIALESSTKTILKPLLKKLIGTEQGSILEAIVKEASLVTMAKVILTHTTSDNNSINIDWHKIQTLYNTRNTIIHQSMRRLPKFSTLKDQFIEILKLVNHIENTKI